MSVKRTSAGRAAMSAYDPKRASTHSDPNPFQNGDVR
jgi:hypothetical protein